MDMDTCPCGETDWTGDGPDALAAELAEAKMTNSCSVRVCTKCELVGREYTQDGKCPKDICDGDWVERCRGEGRLVDDAEPIQVGSFTTEWAINDTTFEKNDDRHRLSRLSLLHRADITAWRQNGKSWFESSERLNQRANGNKKARTTNCFEFVQVHVPVERQTSYAWLRLRFKGKGFFDRMRSRWVYLPYTDERKYEYKNTMRFLEFLRQEYDLEEVEESILNGILRN